MPTGALTEYVDLAQVMLYVFWVFFFFLIVYLVREGKREGYPLEPDKHDDPNRVLGNFPSIPSPKTFLLPHGRGTVTVPDHGKDRRELALVPVAPWPGAPFAPTGNPLVDGVGPASYTPREDAPDLTAEGQPRLLPMRTTPEVAIAVEDIDPRGLAVIGADRRSAGRVVDVWSDVAEKLIRYLEIELEVGTAPRRALLPMAFALVRPNRVEVNALLAHQFADIPGVKDPDRVTLLEEDKIMGYYGGGYLYATPARTEAQL